MSEDNIIFLITLPSRKDIHCRRKVPCLDLSRGGKVNIVDLVAPSFRVPEPNVDEALRCDVACPSSRGVKEI
ncbi:hypothetical protein DPMN_158025 [Dreissena polymorpha]|uniref:Uncharacterized protein n=1 Tax=Dreissena polymorpha TaxID=45954 RepID=A0A9D4IPE8_DREPO|nr:hypothetical protein DPMN_158025 [Dreissena polymorpha]